MSSVTSRGGTTSGVAKTAVSGEKAAQPRRDTISTRVASVATASGGCTTAVPPAHERGSSTAQQASQITRGEPPKDASAQFTQMAQHVHIALT